MRRRLPPGAAEHFPIELRALGDLVPDAPAPSAPMTQDPDDYLVALAAGADLLVSGDPDIMGLVAAVPPMLTPAAFLRRLDEEQPGRHPKIPAHSSSLYPC